MFIERLAPGPASFLQYVIILFSECSVASIIKWTLSEQWYLFKFFDLLFENEDLGYICGISKM